MYMLFNPGICRSSPVPAPLIPPQILGSVMHVAVEMHGPYHDVGSLH